MKVSKAIHHIFKSDQHSILPRSRLSGKKQVHQSLHISSARLLGAKKEAWIRLRKILSSQAPKSQPSKNPSLSTNPSNLLHATPTADKKAGSVSPALDRKRFRKQTPIHSALRASPFPKVTDLTCRLPLLTLLQCTRGCSPWGPDAVIGTVRSANKSLPLLFKDCRECTGHPTSWMLFPVLSPFLWVNHFQGRVRDFELLKRKENSFRDSRQCHRDRLCCHTLSTSWFRNINLIPFR